jgi:hypothetical protein
MFGIMLGGLMKGIEKEGILVNYGDFRFKIARAGGSNQDFRRLLQAKLKPFRHQMDNDTMDEKASEAIVREVYARTIVLGWETKVSEDPSPEGTWEPWLETPDGKTKFSVEACIKVLTDLPELFKDIQSMASKAAHYRKAEEEADTGN